MEKTVWRRALDLKTEEPIALPGIPEEFLPNNHLLIPRESEKTELSSLAVTGYIMIGLKPFLLSSRPILTSNDKGPIQGTFILGHFIDKEILTKLAKQARVDFEAFHFCGSAVRYSIILRFSFDFHSTFDVQRLSLF